VGWEPGQDAEAEVMDCHGPPPQWQVPWNDLARIWQTRKLPAI